MDLYFADVFGIFFLQDQAAKLCAVSHLTIPQNGSLISVIYFGSYGVTFFLGSTNVPDNTREFPALKENVLLINFLRIFFT
jgi:hypothetical protein